MLEWRSQARERRTNRPRSRTTTSFTRTRRSSRRSAAGGWRALGETRSAAFGEVLGGEPLEWGRLANEHPPKLLTHDRYGERIDEIEFHPAWDSLLQLGLEARVQSLPWVDERPGAHVARAALFMLLGAGRGRRRLPALDDVRRRAGPAGATRARGGVDPAPDERRRALRDGDDRAPGWLRRPRERDDRARATGTPGPSTATSGSARRRCRDAFLVLAQAPAGLSCFLVERPQAGFRIERLKDKLGNRSNASAEIALDGAAARLVGAEGRGLHTILEMVNHTRLDCVLGSTALMRRAVAEATHHAAHRSAFGRLLAEQPLMRNVLADLCVESEAATVTALRLARAFDEARRPVPAPGDRRRQVLDLQANASARRRGAGVPGRQRLRRGVAAAAPLPREPAQLDLGRLRQRERARRPACART